MTDVRPLPSAVFLLMDCGLVVGAALALLRQRAVQDAKKADSNSTVRLFLYVIYLIFALSIRKWGDLLVQVNVVSQFYGLCNCRCYDGQNYQCYHN